MIIKKYGDIPALYAPDVGEVLEARRSVVDQWVGAVVLRVQRMRAGTLRVTVVWMADDPSAGSQGKPIVRHTRGWIVMDTRVPLIRQVSRTRAAEIIAASRDGSSSR